MEKGKYQTGFWFCFPQRITAVHLCSVSVHFVHCRLPSERLWVVRIGKHITKTLASLFCPYIHFVPRLQNKHLLLCQKQLRVFSLFGSCRTPLCIYSFAMTLSSLCLFSAPLMNNNFLRESQGLYGWYLPKRLSEAVQLGFWRFLKSSSQVKDFWHRCVLSRLLMATQWQSTDYHAEWKLILTTLDLNFNQKYSKPKE